LLSELTSKIAKETPQKHFEDNHCANSSPCVKNLSKPSAKKTKQKFAFSDLV
jgi:hypothetical protein